jgi:hypothetical protein
MCQPSCVLVLVCVGSLSAGCGKAGAHCPDASYLEPVYWSGQSAPCSQEGQTCPVSYRDVCSNVSGTAECFDYGKLGGRGTAWIFHMEGDDTCCPKSEPTVGTACQQPAGAGAHLCRYGNDAGPGYLCGAGAWCSPSACP